MPVNNDKILASFMRFPFEFLANPALFRYVLLGNSTSDPSVGDSFSEKYRGHYTNIRVVLHGCNSFLLSTNRLPAPWPEPELWRVHQRCIPEQYPERYRKTVALPSEDVLSYRSLAISHSQPSAVMGMFLWDDEQSTNFRNDLDMELSRWVLQAATTPSMSSSPSIPPQSLSLRCPCRPADSRPSPGSRIVSASKP